MRLFKGTTTAIPSLDLLLVTPNSTVREGATLAPSSTPQIHHPPRAIRNEAKLNSRTNYRGQLRLHQEPGHLGRDARGKADWVGMPTSETGQK